MKKQLTFHGETEQIPRHLRIKSRTRLEGEDDLDKEEKAILKKLKEKEHDDLIKGLIMLRDYYKAEYKRALQDKVERQRKIMQQQQHKLEEQMKLSQQLEKLKHHKVPHRLPRSILINDKQPRDNSRQTDYYKIISLENKLKKEGYLSKVHEVNEFWDFICVPENLANVIKDGDLTWERIIKYHKERRETPMLSGKSQQKSHEQLIKERPLKRASAMSTWRRTTHGIRTILLPSSPCDGANGGQKSGRRISRRTPPTSAIPMEQRFPKVEFPPLAAYRLEFGEPELDPEEVRKQEEADKRLEARNSQKRTLNTMFSHALANRAATQRLMDKNDDYNFESLAGTADFDEFHELVSVHHKQTGCTNKSQPPRKSSSKSSGSKSRTGSKKACSNSRKSPVTDVSDRSDSNLSLSSGKDLTFERPALCLDQLSKNSVVKEAKGRSTFWLNPAAKSDLTGDWNIEIVS